MYRPIYTVHTVKSGSLTAVFEHRYRMFTMYRVAPKKKATTKLSKTY